MSDIKNVNDATGTPASLRNDESRPVGSLTAEVLFINDVAQVLRTSRSTIERRRRGGRFPIAELPCFDGRPRWSRQAVERFLSTTSNGMANARARRGRQR
jgi:hypothetical protein